MSIIKDDGFRVWGNRTAKLPADFNERLAEKRAKVDELIAGGMPMWEAIKSVCKRIGDVYVGGKKIT